MTRAVLLLVAVLALVFGASACGEDDTEQFKEDYNQAVRPLSALGDDVAASLVGAEGQSDRAIATQYDKLADRFERARKNLSRLEPPEGTEEEFDELLALLKRGVTDLRAVARAAQEGDPAEAQKATRTLVKTGQRLREAEEEFRNAVG